MQNKLYYFCLTSRKRKGRKEIMVRPMGVVTSIEAVQHCKCQCQEAVKKHFFYAALNT